MIYDGGKFMRSKFFIINFMVFLVLSANLLATETRMQALGNPNGFTRDYTDIFRFPGTIHNYQNLVVAELTNPWDGGDWTLGAVIPINHLPFSIHLNRATGVSPRIIDTMDLSRKIEFGLGFGRTFGMRFAMAIDNMDINSDLVRNASYFQVSGGMSSDVTDLAMGIYLAGTSEDNNVERDEGFFGINFDVRHFFLDNEDLSMMAIGGLGLEFYSSELVYDDFSYEASSFSLDLQIGAGINYKIAEDSILILALKPFRLVTISEEDEGSNELTETWIYLPEYHIGLESRINNWLTGRLGARQSYAFYSEKDNPDTESSVEYSEYQSEFVMDLGLAFNFGHFTIDMVIENDFLFNGPDFIGGNANGIASKISVSYHF